MEEHPSDHDFDQRHDGPLQRPSVHIATDTHPRFKDPIHDAVQRTTSGNSAKSMPEASRSPSSPVASPPRHSTQIARQRRTSRDFDVRRDGPYGRPSLTMTRRASSGLALPTSPIVQGADQAVVDGVAGEEDKEAAGADAGHVASDPTAPGRSPTEPQQFQSMSISDPAFEPEPPPLNYTLHTRKMSIAIFWSLILIDSIAMPIALYFGLWYGTSLSPNAVFSIVTAALGGVSILEYFVRFWRLWKKGSTCRVIGARRMYLDWFHWNFTFAWIVVMIELIVGTVPENPPIRLLSMPLASMLYAFAVELLIIDIMRYFQYPAPCRISSIPKGAQLRPCIYSVIEDVVAVDGSGGTAYREALNKRYEASHVFRAMLRRLGVVWAVGAMGCAVLVTVIVFTISEDAAYVVGWTVPFIWAGIWIVGTIYYVKACLRKEKQAWAEEVAAKTNA